MRFATNFLMIEELLKVRFVIEQTIINHQWTIILIRISHPFNNKFEHIDLGLL
jgi:hypothetical protein